MTLTIGSLLPDVMGTYGDGGNATILLKRAQLYGIKAQIIPITIFDSVPESLDIYVLGGAEDFAQQLAVKHLTRYPGLQKAINHGATVLAICAAMQILGKNWKTSAGQEFSGLGIVDISTFPMQYRAIGETIAQPLASANSWGITELLTGFENHRGGSILGPTVQPLAEVLHGVGNAYFSEQDLPHVEGFLHDSVLGTYLHGPLLARNPQIADVIISKATGISCDSLIISDQMILREQRLAAGRKRPANPAEAILPLKV